MARLCSLPRARETAASLKTHSHPPSRVDRYKAGDDDELSFAQGEHIYVAREDDDGWWLAVRQVDGAVGYVPNTFLTDNPISSFHQRMPAELVGMDDDDQEDVEDEGDEDTNDSVSTSSGSGRSVPNSINSVGSTESASWEAPAPAAPTATPRPQPMPRRSSSSTLDREATAPVPKPRSPQGSDKEKGGDGGGGGEGGGGDFQPPPPPAALLDDIDLLPPPPPPLEDEFSMLPPPPLEEEPTHISHVKRDSTEELLLQTFVPPPPVFDGAGPATAGARDSRVTPRRHSDIAPSQAGADSASLRRHTDDAPASSKESPGPRRNPHKSSLVHRLGAELNEKLTKRSIEGFSRVMSVRKSVKPPTGKRPPTVAARKRRVSAQTSADFNKLPPAAPHLLLDKPHPGGVGSHSPVVARRGAAVPAVAPRRNTVGAGARPVPPASDYDAPPPPPPPADY